MGDQPIKYMGRNWSEYSDAEREQLTSQQLHDISMLACEEIVELAVQDLVRSLQEAEIASDKILRKIRSDNQERKIEGIVEGARMLQNYSKTLTSAVKAISAKINQVVG